jgi:hypothetical protein
MIPSQLPLPRFPVFKSLRAAWGGQGLPITLEEPGIDDSKFFGRE